MKPPVGTAERLAMDLADYGETWRFIRDEIRAAGGKRGARRAAIIKAAKQFGIDYKTAERHYEKLRKFDNDKGMGLLAGDLFRRYAPGMNEALSIITAAFSADELQQLRGSFHEIAEGENTGAIVWDAPSVGVDFALQLARERLELIELRKGRKRK